MKFIALFLILTAATGAIAADPFGARVQRAKLAEESSQGQAFQKELWDAVGDYMAGVMQKCFPKGVKADTNFFTLVATLMPDGNAAMVDVQPTTAMTQCFSKGFAEAPFPGPPASFGPEGMPLVIEMKIKP